MVGTLAPWHTNAHTYTVPEPSQPPFLAPVFENAGMSLPHARTATMAKTTLGPTSLRSSRAGRVSPNSTDGLAWLENVPSTCHLVEESQDALARAHLAAMVARRSAVAMRPFSLTPDTSHIEE